MNFFRSNCCNHCISCTNSAKNLDPGCALSICRLELMENTFGRKLSLVTLVRVLSQTYTHQFMAFLFPFKKFSCALGSLCPDFCKFKVAYFQTIMCSKLPMSDYLAFKLPYVQTVVRSFLFPDRAILNARNHPCAFTLVWTY